MQTSINEVFYTLFFFGESLKSSVYFILRAHLNSDWPHF